MLFQRVLDNLSDLKWNWLRHTLSSLDLVPVNAIWSKVIGKIMMLILHQSTLITALSEAVVKVGASETNPITISWHAQEVGWCRGINDFVH
jgi:hypothetical protein